MRRAKARWGLLLALAGLGALGGFASPVGAGEPLSLPEAAARAVESHPSLRAGLARLQASQARADAARAGFYPRLEANLGSTYSESSGARTSGLTVIRSGGVSNYSVGVSARQILLDFGRRRSQARAADFTVRAAEEELEGALQELLLRLAEAYFSVLRGQRSVTIQQENLRDASERLRQAEGFYRAGTRARIEVTRAEADQASARLALLQARNEERQARVDLGILVGASSEWEGRLEDRHLPVPAWDAEEACRLALGSRPDVLAAQDRVESARARVLLARAEAWPTLSASGQYAFADNVFPPQQSQWSLGVSMNLPLLQVPTLAAGVAEAEAAHQELLAELEGLHLRVRQEVTRQLLEVRSALEQQGASAAGLRSAEASFTLASERYRVGVGSSLELSEAQRLLVESRSQAAQARLALDLAVVRLYRAAGALSEQVLGLEGEVPAAGDSPPPRQVLY